jgi:hypothetical protein
LIVNRNMYEINTLILLTSQQWGDIDGVGYKVALHGKAVKVRQDSTVMDHTRVKGKQEAWHQSTKGNGEEQVNPSMMNCAKSCEGMDDQHHSFRYTFMTL